MGSLQNNSQSRSSNINSHTTQQNVCGVMISVRFRITLTVAMIVSKWKSGVDFTSRVISFVLVISLTSYLLGVTIVREIKSNHQILLTVFGNIMQCSQSPKTTEDAVICFVLFPLYVTTADDMHETSVLTLHVQNNHHTVVHRRLMLL